MSLYCLNSINHNVVIHGIEIIKQNFSTDQINAESKKQAILSSDKFAAFDNFAIS